VYNCLSAVSLRAGPENLAAQGGGWKAGRRLIPIEKTLIAADARE